MARHANTRCSSVPNTCPLTFSSGQKRQKGNCLLNYWESLGFITRIDCFCIQQSCLKSENMARKPQGVSYQFCSYRTPLTLIPSLQSHVFPPLPKTPTGGGEGGGGHYIARSSSLHTTRQEAASRRLLCLESTLLATWHSPLVKATSTCYLNICYN